MKKIEVPDDIANDSGLEKLDKIEKFASKMKMNRTQIKGVIRGICETPELLHLALKQSESFFKRVVLIKPNYFKKQSASSSFLQYLSY